MRAERARARAGIGLGGFEIDDEATISTARWRWFGQRTSLGPDRDDGRTGLATRRARDQKPSLYNCSIEDDYTPMEFVVHVLEKYFGKGRDEATRIMLHVHHKGVGICGVYPYEVAETKVTQVMDFSRQNGHPLQCTMEKE
jgi:ATP-dependent Clp protease adaptor protein ClpS